MTFVKLDHKINLEKKNGKPFENIPAHVQFPTIFVTDESIPIEKGDLIDFTPSNNLTEHYIVIEPGFHPKQGSFPAHYQVKVERNK